MTRSHSTVNLRGLNSVEDVVAKIDALIASGELVPGQRLVEADLMHRLSASRATVRAALQYLAGDGIVELLPNRGGRIRRFESERLRDIMQVLIGGIFRIAIELFVARELTPVLRDQLNSRLDGIRSAAKAHNVVMLADAMARYNEFICANSGNAYIQEMLSKVHLRHYAKQFVSEDDLNDLILAADGYETITSHLLSGRADEAYAVLRYEADRSILRFQKATDAG